MEISFFRHTAAFLWSFALGAVLFVLYMIFDIVRAAAPPGRVRLFVEDIIFMMLAAVLNYLFALSQTNGSVRFFSIMAQLVSFGLLYVLTGRFIKQFVMFLRCKAIRVYSTLSGFFVIRFSKASAVLKKTCFRLLKKNKL